MKTTSGLRMGVAVLAVSLASAPVLAHDDGPYRPTNGMRDGIKLKAVNGMRDGLHGQAVNGMRDGVQGKAVNGMRDGVQGKALDRSTSDRRPFARRAPSSALKLERQ